MVMIYQPMRCGQRLDMATLYDVDVRTINYHVKKIFSDSELQEDSVIRKFRITATDGKSYSTNHYSLEMIIAVGFKVNSERAVQFRKWVNQIAKDYTIKGWVMDYERLKNGGSVLTTEYFDRLLEQIREIRLSERRFYQKITDIYATALDYDRTAKTTKQFFAKVQNKMHYAVHGHTAAELIYERADADKLVDKETSPKYYFMDTGLLGLMLLDSKSAQLENLVAIELIRRYGVKNVFFFENNVEIDFYIPSERLAIQVSLQVLDDIDTKERETRAFAKLNNFIPGSKCILITNSEETNLEYDGIDIEVIPIWKWLLMADL